MSRSRGDGANEPDVRSGLASEISAELGVLREKIDEVDREILERLNRRAKFVEEVGHLKSGGKLSPIYVASRERDIVANLIAGNPGPFPNQGIVHVFREIISATRSLEKMVSVAYLGPEGTFSHLAAIRQFGTQVDLQPSQNISEVFLKTERGETHFGVVPVENTTEGAVTECYDSLVDSNVTICGELMLEISQNLLRLGGGMDGIERVASLWQPLAQCREWLRRCLPDVEIIETTSTAQAAKLAAKDAKLAAIGSAIAADAYGLEVVESGIEDLRGNTTRFLVIGRETPASSGNDLTSVVFTARKNQSGALHRLLESFARHNVNLTAIQSRPVKSKPWEYLFFVDMEGHLEDEHLAKALAEAARLAHSHKILGSYPRAQQIPSPIINTVNDSVEESTEGTASDGETEHGN
ncbi:MAG: prephenate dehydratase [Deltaproteobacteria bacterium]|nr:prephenate dehydratase [Deltaproteobacteria bacterium]